METLTTAVLGLKEAAVTDTLVGAGIVVKWLLWWQLRRQLSLLP